MPSSRQEAFAPPAAHQAMHRKKAQAMHRKKAREANQCRSLSGSPPSPSRAALQSQWMTMVVVEAARAVLGQWAVGTMPNLLQARAAQGLLARLLLQLQKTSSLRQPTHLDPMPRCSDHRRTEKG